MLTVAWIKVVPYRFFHDEIPLALLEDQQQTGIALTNADLTHESAGSINTWAQHYCKQPARYSTTSSIISKEANNARIEGHTPVSVPVEKNPSAVCPNFKGQGGIN